MLQGRTFSLHSGSRVIARFILGARTKRLEIAVTLMVIAMAFVLLAMPYAAKEVYGLKVAKATLLARVFFLGIAFGALVLWWLIRCVQRQPRTCTTSWSMI